MAFDWKKEARDFWDRIKDEKVGDLAMQARLYAEVVAAGADPIEALHGHLCGPKCWHWDSMTRERRELLKKAPWNQ
jgi:hypothetical protein